MPGTPDGPFRIHGPATRELLERVAAERRERGPFEAAKRTVRLAGAQAVDGRAEFGVWLPDVPSGARVELELLQRTGTVPHGSEGRTGIVRQRLEMTLEGEWAWACVTGAVAGARDQEGTLYRFVVATPDGEERIQGDPLAASLPFGPWGPAELYDVPRMHVGRPDVDLFRRLGIGGADPGGEPPRRSPPSHILQLHVGTATHGGTLADLTDLYRALAEKVAAGVEPSPAESAFLGYDAVQLLPLEPVAEHPGDPAPFELVGQGSMLEAIVRPRRTIDWGYDTTIFGSAALSPTLLRSGRPDELVDFAAALHTFPGKPIGLILDVVFGHADVSAAELLPARFFLGANMYGLDLDAAEPTVRATLLEMQRRKVDFGADGVRVDAAQDHKVVGPNRGEMVHDDAYLREMSALVQQVAEVPYRPFMIFEDGRPWPREDWETAASYLDVVEDQPHALQWGPLAFAHNTPFREGFWGTKWWRIEESADHGSHWISGCANHDTMRRGHQTPLDAPLNRRLGDHLPEILANAYDHPAADLLFYGFLPGVPMTFVAGPLHAPWAFLRDTDDRWAVKVAAEESGVFAWRFGPRAYAREDAFVRIKRLGLANHDDAWSFFAALHDAVAAGAEDADEVSAWLRQGPVETPVETPVAIDAEALKALSRAFMRDLRDACVVWRSEPRLVSERLAFGSALRRLRRSRAWLRDDLHLHDRLARQATDHGGTLARGERHAPDGSEWLAIVANLDGEPRAVHPREGLADGPWRLLLATPGVAWHGPDEELVLRNAEGVLLHVPA